MKNTTKGFTLIELLVVVLIIGILTSVALPQYQKSVEKARATEAMAYADAFVKAQQIYCMANGQFAELDELTNLDISLPTMKHFYVNGPWDSTGGTIYIYRNDSAPISYQLAVDMEKPNAQGVFVVHRRCLGNSQMCYTINGGADCSHGGGDGDKPWCID